MSQVQLQMLLLELVILFNNMKNPKFSIIKLSTIATLVYSFPLLAAAQIRVKFNSLIGVSSLEELFLAILNVFIVIAIPIVILYIIYAGFLYVTARGDVEQTKKATRALTYAIIGGVILIGAVAITEVVANVVGAFTTR